MSSAPFIQVIDGFQLPGMFSADIFRAVTKYKPRPDDLFLATYPKCGTTWTGQILILILQKGEPLKNAADLHAKAPFLEMTGVDFVEKMMRPGPIKTHLPFHLTPFSKDAKYIYVTRNPKDCCVSYFHHMKNLPGHGTFNGTFDEFFELFISGKIEFGDYFDNLLSWYPHRNDPNVLFVTYEELKEDIDAAILKMASFIDDEEYAEPIRKDPRILENIKKYSSLKETKEFMTRSFAEVAVMSKEELEKSQLPDLMKNMLVKQKDKLKAALEGKEEKGPSLAQFVRKGIIGDWKNYFSEDQSRRLDEKFAERTKGTEISNFWKKYIIRKMSSVPFSQDIDGFQVPGMFSADNFRGATKYKPRPDDLFLVTYPKCGTTWTGQILILILQKGEPLKNPSDLHAKAPFIEMTGVDFVDKMMRPGPIKTHLPFHLTPFSKDAKYICVTRNPKDCCVSYFHHMRNLPGHNFNGTFDEFFELFISGKIDYGDYFDHLLSWYPHRNDPNVLFVTYEELKEDIDTAIFKMASFIDDEKYAEPIRKDPKILENIKKYSSLKEMKEFMTRSFTEVAEMSPEALEKSHLPDLVKHMFVQQKDKLKASLEGKEEGPSMTQFVRKGIIGDWKNYFSEDQSRRLEEKFAERTKGTEISNFWKQYM